MCVPVPAPGPAPAPGPGVPAGNVVAGAMTWRPRESFVRYMNSEDGRIPPSAGATDGPSEVLPGSDAPLVYSFGLPFAAERPPPRRPRVGIGGTVTFAWPTRGIDIGFSDAVVTLGPAGGRLVRLSGATAGAPPGRGCGCSP